MNKLKALFKRHAATLILAVAGMTSIIEGDPCLAFLTGCAYIAIAITVCCKPITVVNMTSSFDECEKAPDKLEPKAEA